jgi:hypothetical protein
MIDQISKLKDHVNVSIMKAVQVDESKDTLCSFQGRVIVYGQQSIGGHESFWIFIIIEEIYRQFKSDCCGRSPVACGRSPILLLNGEWNIFGCFSIFFPSLKMLWYGYLQDCTHTDNIYSV